MKDNKVELLKKVILIKGQRLLNKRLTDAESFRLVENVFSVAVGEQTTEGKTFNNMIDSLKNSQDKEKDEVRAVVEKMNAKLSSNISREFKEEIEAIKLLAENPEGNLEEFNRVVDSIYNNLI